MILLTATEMPPVVSYAEQSKASDLVLLWDSYQHAEFEATGGYNCDRKQHKVVAEAFERRFSKRAAQLRSVAIEQLGGQAVSRNLEVIAICRKATSLRRLKEGLDRNLNSFEAILARTESAFGIKWGN